MPINAYTGLMGSGKSYEVVSSVIIDALSKGRRVVSNIDGLNFDNICQYLTTKRGIPREQIGSVIAVSNDQVKSPNFFFHGTADQTIVQPGDLVCIDEAWRFWGAGEVIPDPHFIFFREHRHYANPETQVCCDLVLMVQDIGDLHRKLKAVVELTFRTKKHKALGLARYYVVSVHEGYRVNEKTLVNRLQKKYDAEIFPLYSSYAGGKGKEVTIDKRQNLLLSKGFLIPVLIAALAGAWGVTKTWEFLHPKQASSVPTPVSKDSSPQLATTDKGGPASAAVVQPSEPFRLLGFYSRADGEFIVLYVDGTHIRTAKARSFVFDGYQSMGFIDGRPVAFIGGMQ